MRERCDDRYYCFWPDGGYSLCLRIGDEWILRLPDYSRVGAPRLLLLWRVARRLGGRFGRL